LRKAPLWGIAFARLFRLNLSEGECNAILRRYFAWFPSLAMAFFSGLFSASALLSGNRTTVLNTLGWMMLLLIAGLIGTASAGVPQWTLVLLATCLMIDFLVFIGAYIYFAVTAPEFLRSESYSIQKLAIEKRYLGDSSSGVFPLEEIDPALREVSANLASPQIEHKQ
jgi:hypothetical protein